MIKLNPSPGMASLNKLGNFIPPDGQAIKQVPPIYARGNTISDNINIIHLHKIVYLSNNILQMKNIPYKERICCNKNNQVVFFEAVGGDDGLNDIDPCYQLAYLIAFGCCINGIIVTPEHMLNCNDANKLMKAEIADAEARQKTG